MRDSKLHVSPDAALCQAPRGQGPPLGRAPEAAARRNIIPRIARTGIESSERLGRHGRKIQRFLGLAAAPTCSKKSTKIATSGKVLLLQCDFVLSASATIGGTTAYVIPLRSPSGVVISDGENELEG